MAWLTGWDYCKKIKVPASDIDGALSNFPLTVYLKGDNFDFTKCKADGSDIRFTDKNLNQLKFERKEHNRPRATFDGSGDYFTFGTTNLNYLNTDIPTGIYSTFEAWVYLKAYSSGAQNWQFSSFVVKGNNYFSVGVINGKVRLHWHTPSAVHTVIDSASTSDVPLNTLVHVAVTISGSTVKIYVNGVLNTTSTAFTGVSSGCLNGVEYIGRDPNMPTDWNGYLFGVKISKSVKYTSNFTPPDYFEVDDTDVVLCTNFDTELSGGAFQDDTGKTITAYGNATNVMGNAVYNVQVPTVSDTADTNIYMWYGNENAYNASIEAWQDMTGKALTYNGNVKLEYDSTLGKRRAVFDGSGDYFSLADSEDWNFGSGDFCVETKFNFTSVASDMAIFCQPNANGYSPVALIFYAASKKLQLLASSNGTGWQQLGTYTTATLDASTDYHIALVRSGNVFSVYIDGVVQLNATNALTLYNSTNLFLIGSNYNAQYINCSMRGFRITKGRARYTGTFTPPTTFDIDGDDVVFCTNFDTIYDENYAMVQHMGDSLVDASGNGNNGTATGTTVVSTDYGKARQFDGTDDKIVTPLISATDNITMLAMATKVGTGGTDCLFYVGTSGTNGYGLWTNSLKFSLKATSTYADTSVDLSTTPKVVVLKRTSGTWTCFIDGTEYSITNLSVTTPTGFIYLGGTASADYFDGILANARLSESARADAWIKAESLALKNALVVITDYKKGGSLFFGMNF